MAQYALLQHLDSTAGQAPLTEDLDHSESHYLEHLTESAPRGNFCDSVAVDTHQPSTGISRGASY